MADFNFSDLASQYLTKQFDPVNKLFSDPSQYLKDSVSGNTGINFSNTSTNDTFEMPEMAARQTMAPVDYSLSAPQARVQGLPQQGPVSPSTWQGQTDEFGGMEEKPLEQSLAKVIGGFNQLRGGNGPTEIPEGPAVPEAAAVKAPIQEPQQARPVSPISPAESIARQESGANPNIGYHYPANEQGQRASSAYGKYGITAPAYADIQRADPYFANRPITSLTQAEQDRAFQIDRANRTKQLQAFNVEPTEGALAAAHFAGAKGLSDFLTKKDDQGRPYISPAAQAANGGYDKTRAIIESRLNGGTAPASAAAQPTAAVPPTAGQPTTETATAPEAYTGQGISAGGLNQRHLEALNSKDPKSLFQLAYDPTTSPGIQRMALDNLYRDTNTRKNIADAEAAVNKRLEQGDVNGLTRDMNKKGDEGSYIKAYLFKRLGLDKLADQEMEKISPTLTASTIQYGEQTYIGQYDRNGNLRSAKNSQTGENADSATLLKMAASGGPLGKGTSLSAEVYVDKEGNRYRSGYDNAGKAALVNIQGGAPFKGDPKDLKIQSVDTAAQKAENAAAIKLRYAGPTSYTAAGAAFAGKFNAENGTNIGYASQAPGAPLVDLNTGKPVQVSAGGIITTTQNATPAAAPAGNVPAPSGQVQGEGETKSYGPPAPKFREPGFENESASTFSARQKAWQETYKDQYKNQQENVKNAKSILPEISNMKKLIDQGTSSGFGAIVDSAGNFIGYSTPGATAIAAIAPLADKILKSVERFQGPQSDKDVASYKEAAGKLADPTIPAAQKQAAFNTIIGIMRRNAPDLDWDTALGVKSSGGKQSSGTQEGQTGTSKSGKPIIYRNGRWEYQ